MSDQAEVSGSRTALLGVAERGVRAAQWSRWIATIAVVVGLLQIVATYNVFAPTFDEPAHIAAGMQLVDKGEFTYEPLHPPLARIAAAIGPYAAGFRSQNGGDMWIEGRRLFIDQRGRTKDQLLTLARLGVLPFFVLCLAGAYHLAARNFGPPTAATTTVLLASLPLLLAHAGLATTDMVFTATFTVAFLAFMLWLDEPSTRRSAALGGAVALAVVSKLTALLFLPAAFLSVMLYRWAAERGRWAPWRPFARWQNWLASLAASFVVIWAAYGFDDQPFEGLASLYAGVRELLAFGHAGQASYFMGEIRSHGWWSFFPVLIAVKTPLPFLIAFAIGAGGLLTTDRRNWRRTAPLVAALAILACIIPSPIDIGLRHLLPVFPLLAIVAGYGIARLWASRARSALAMLIALVLPGWQAVEAARTEPDHLAYFNQLAGDHPERIIVGSDLDWGQDVDRLRAELRRRDVAYVKLAVHSSSDLRRRDFPRFDPLYPGERATGWIAISAQARAYYCSGYEWLDAYQPIAQIGRSIQLYHLPTTEPSAGSPRFTEPFDWATPRPCSSR